MTKEGELVKFLGEHGYTVDKLPEWWGVHGELGVPTSPITPGQMQLLAK